MNVQPPPAYPDYDVLAKRNSPSWDHATRLVVDARLGTPDEPAWCDPAQWRTLRALCATVVPQPGGRAPVPLAALVDRKIARGRGDGYRNAKLPPMQQAWRIALAALDEECRSRHGAAFADVGEPARIALLQAMERGALMDDVWQGMPAALFFTQHVLHDICTTYYAHPIAWSEIGFGGPANPRGYVRMNFNRRDPWEAAEARPGDEARAARKNRHAR
ncbi:gluconate 2-dehydrogenase subunit 3 family protein [Paraburkholderia sp. MMS20-SJTN17]|uniref:Gluconate 2-dehydrogenase subunit 3 family protein n=1 Tax=Paraburkholderia translucens TaxID=2886945 RepID=A0ABS8KMA2_9BURK|nr:gluconate 2-dehydrogenase subunit 3 family protein [Paraburkholderia sp. MMS20-SJTN17]MCC8405876.1 gluconate 2-dehydrogenase subunit 3 family protein [Paraburkholderia sp. MMS20-SJTN17]